MQKKNLSDAFNEHKAKTEASQEAKASVPTTSEHSDLPPSRQGKTRLTAWVKPQVKNQIGHIAVDEDISKEQVVCNALNELFIKMGLPPIA